MIYLKGKRMIGIEQKWRHAVNSYQENVPVFRDCYTRAVFHAKYLPGKFSLKILLTYFSREVRERERGRETWMWKRNLYPLSLPHP